MRGDLFFGTAHRHADSGAILFEARQPFGYNARPF